MRLTNIITLITLFLFSNIFADRLVDPKGSYKTVPLEKDEIIIKVIQSDVKSIANVSTARKTMLENLNHMVNMGKKACAEGDKPDILLYHEFPLTGYFTGDRATKLATSITIPGEETKALGKLAKECDAYLIFGAYVNDPNWAGHVLSINTVFGRDGNITMKVWKVRNIKRFYDTFEITTTTIESVRDKFRSMNSIEDEFPVLRTEFGNIAVSTVQLDPFVFAAFAMKGTEIMLRTATMYYQEDVINTARTHYFYSAMSNIPGEGVYGGNSMVVNYYGDVMGQLSDTEEGILSAKIDIAKFRKNRKLPQYSTEMTKEIFAQYVQEIPLNHMDLPKDKLPKDGVSMKTLLDTVSRWLN
jgi:predicted amidohydrolase